ncbi:VirK family protein [Allorhizobium taibaishanense]|uniref:VirK protein n=1 Tax=Allorhizobium taibaishanense TaxID=887144 RepID=A0A1Q8ZZK5_9HYPH|nr:VirK family protein [Allorhizobium taibaishanense]MBB4007219.1 hypothetical protein [Allorhizobium taibaishanense]OLP47772.1 hypothetical protein BJF91_05255 [Allorhizobium taibaishanense]
MHYSIAPAIGLGLFLMPLASHAATALPNAGAVQTALTSGETVNVVLDLTKCTSADDQKKPGTMKGGLRISAFLIRPDNSISFSDEHFTITTMDKKPIYQFLRYSLKPDDTVSFTMTTLSMPEMTQKGEVIAYNCKLGDGMSFFKP